MKGSLSREKTSGFRASSCSMSSMDFVKLGEQEGGHRDRIIRTLLKFQIVTGDFVFVTFETFDEESQICADGMRPLKPLTRLETS